MNGLKCSYGPMRLVPRLGSGRAMIRNLMIGVTTAGLLVAVAGCSTSATPRWGYVGPDSTPGWKGENFYSQNGGYVALN